MTMSASLKMVAPQVKIQSGIMKNAAKVDTAVMVTDKSKFPPNITVQMLEAPPPKSKKNVINIFLQNKLIFQSYLEKYR